MTHRDVMRESLAALDENVRVGFLVGRSERSAAALRYALRVIEDVERLAGRWDEQRRGMWFDAVDGNYAAELRDVLREDK